MRTRLLPVLALLALAALLAGCGRSGSVNGPLGGNGTGTTASDEALVTGVLAGQPEVVDDGQADA